MSMLTNGLRTHDFVVQAQGYPTNITRSTVTIVANVNNNLKAGRVIARLASGEYTRFVAGGTGGEEVAVGVLLTDVDATTSSQEAVAIVNGDAYLLASKLDFGVVTPAQKQAAMVDLMNRRFKFVNEGEVFSY